ncbi:MAG: metallophosphoesterase [Lentisphaeria bacterium]|nr:metallophosphoesterase [Lentisphaeria bacterium]
MSRYVVLTAFLFAWLFQPLCRGEELKLQRSDFVFKNGIQHRVQTDVVHNGGVWSISIAPQKQISNGTRGAELRLPLEKISGKTIILRAQMRSHGISSHIEAKHVGGKILGVVTAGKKTRYIGSDPITGNSEWREVYTVIPIPADAEKASFFFGIQQGWGTLEFKDVVCEIDAPAGTVLKPRTQPLPNKTPGKGETYNFLLFGDTHFDREIDVYHKNFTYSKGPFGGTQRREFQRYAAMWKERSPRMLSAAKTVSDKFNSAFILQLGDLVQGDCSSSADHLKMLLEALDVFKKTFPGKKFLTVCGNHDVRGVCAVRPYREFSAAHHSRELGRDIRKTTFAYRHGGDLYLFADFTCPDTAEIKKILHKNQDARYKFLIVHAPVLPSDKNLTHWFFLGDQNRQRSEMRELLLKNNVIVLAGHTHTFELLECQTDFGSITQFITSSVWVHESLKKPVIRAKTPAEYGKYQRKNPAAFRFISEVSPAVSRYFYGDAAGFSRIEVTPEGVTAYFYGGDAVTPTQTVKLR